MDKPTNWCNNIPSLPEVKIEITRPGEMLIFHLLCWQQNSENFPLVLLCHEFVPTKSKEKWRKYPIWVQF